MRPKDHGNHRNYVSLPTDGVSVLFKNENMIEYVEWFWCHEGALILM